MDRASIELPGNTLALGLDAGGTATRWCLVDGHGTELERGVAPGFSATQLGTLEQPLLDAALAATAIEVTKVARGRPLRIAGGLTGFDGSPLEAPGPLHAHIARAFGLPASSVRLMSDIELACRATFAPGHGILVMAGTGSIAAHLRAGGELERAGGRGSLLDDGGSGYWIAREALRAVWRREDSSPGAWQRSALAQALFAQLGGSTWARTREFVANAARGEFGALATAVAAAAQQGDADAQLILHRAGVELARLALALTSRCGAQPVALAGRVPALGERIAKALRESLAPGTPLTLVQPEAALAAAQYAAGRATAPAE